MSNAQALIDAAEGAREALEGDEAGALAALGRAAALLQDREHIEPEFKALGEVLASSLAQASDAAHSLHAYLRHADADPAHLAELDQRMGLWVSLARRYRRPPAELPALLPAGKTHCAHSMPRPTSTRWSAPKPRRQQAYAKEAKAVGKGRQQAAPRLARPSPSDAGPRHERRPLRGRAAAAGAAGAQRAR